MNKKGLITQIASILLLIVCLIFIYFFVGNQFNQYQEYKEFCEDRPSFCYCSFFTCEYKISYMNKCDGNDCSEKVLSIETQQLCDLAKKLKDKKMMFKAGCGE